MQVSAKDLESAYAPLATSAGLMEPGDRTQVELLGEDRAKFLHNLCTNEIRKLPAGAGCEAFLLDAKGHVVAYVWVFCQADSIVLETVPGQGAVIIGHLDRYLIREKVEIHDRTTAWSEMLIAGPRAAEILKSIVAGELPKVNLGHVQSVTSGRRVSIRRVDWTPAESFLLSCLKEDAAAISVVLHSNGGVDCRPEVFEAARIEAGVPWFGIDVTPANLPQEVARDRSAISFVKGCYLGQETVARIDALGHVNKTLAGLRFEGTDVPPSQLELTREDGQVAGQVTSATWSPRYQAPLALGYVKRGSNAPGTRLASAVGYATVMSLPEAR